MANKAEYKEKLATTAPCTEFGAPCLVREGVTIRFKSPANYIFTAEEIFHAMLPLFEALVSNNAFLTMVPMKNQCPLRSSFNLARISWKSILGNLKSPMPIVNK